MSYYVLARKWRPQVFSDLIGQQHVVKSLSYALSHNQIHHAYLFTGTRGVGKTSIARIFAKSLNCLVNGVSANPCGQCEHCLEIAEGKFVDLIEVDAASRTGVEDTRELIESIPYLPTKGRCKVYLIDEVHMFSNSSFNALLKTLEEPPEHVKFILATTDQDKLPITILSRCLQFNLKSLTKKQLIKHLEVICHKESIVFDDKALVMLAEAGEGSVRDTLSITDQALAYGQGKLSLESVLEILGTTRPADVEAIVFAIATNNPVVLNELLLKLDDYDIDAKTLLTNIMRLLQSMAWAKEGIVRDLDQALQGTLVDIPKELLHLWYDISANGLKELPHAQDEKSLVDMTLLRMCAFIPDNWNPRKYTPVSVDESSSHNDLNRGHSNIDRSNDHLNLLFDDASIKANDDSHQNELSSIESQPIPEKTLDQQEKKGSDAPKKTISSQSDELTDKHIDSQLNNDSQIEGFAHTLHAQPAQSSDSLVDAEQAFINQSSVNAVLLDDNEMTVNEKKTISGKDKLDYSTDVAGDSAEDIVTSNKGGNFVDEKAQQFEASLAHQDTLPTLSSDMSKTFFSIDHEKMGHSVNISASDELTQQVNYDMAESNEKKTFDRPIDLLSKTNESITDNQASSSSIETVKEIAKKAQNNASVSEESSADKQCNDEKPITEEQEIEEKIKIFDWFQMIETLPFTPLIKHCLSMGILSVKSECIGDQPMVICAVFSISSHNSVLLTDQVTENLTQVLGDYFNYSVKVSIQEAELNQPVPMELNQQKKNEVQTQLMTTFNQLPGVSRLVDQLGAEVITSTVKKVTE